jgi:hypothetical protein
MRTLLPAFATIIVLIGIPAWGLAMLDRNASLEVQTLRWVIPVLWLASFGFLIWDRFIRPDLAPDFLKQWRREYFVKEGVAFIVYPDTSDDELQLVVVYQNQYDQPCEATIGLRAKSGLFRKSALESIRIDFDCQPGEFGVAVKRIPVPKELHGQEVSLQIGAETRYPGDPGRLLRFNEGIPLVRDVSFLDPARKGSHSSAVFKTLTARVESTSIAVRIPEGCAEDVSDELVTTKTLWKLGDPPSKELMEQAARRNLPI